MSGLGSGPNGQLTLLDIVSLISFVVGIENLEMNITQDDMQRATNKLDSALRKQVEEIHAHLEQQDNKIDHILEVLGDDKNQTLRRTDR